MERYTAKACGLAAVLVGAFAAVGRAQAAAAANAATAGELEARATFHCIGLKWDLAGDANRNATCQVRFRRQGVAAWRAGLDLFRVVFRPGDLSMNGDQGRAGDRQCLIRLAVSPGPGRHLRGRPVAGRPRWRLRRANHRGDDARAPAGSDGPTIRESAGGPAAAGVRRGPARRRPAAGARATTGPGSPSRGRARPSSPSSSAARPTGRRSSTAIWASAAPGSGSTA